MRPYRGLEGVRPAGDLCLEVAFAGGWSATVRLGPLVGDAGVLQPLRDPAIFRTARVAYHGSGVAWGPVTDELTLEGDIDIGGDQLWRLAGEQTGELMPTADFRAWRERNGLSLGDTAATLGIGRRLAAQYDSGERPVPKTVLLACEAVDARRQLRAA